MPSPLPGMDPYIEQSIVWSDFQAAFAIAISASLNPMLRPRYVARLMPYLTYDQVAIEEPTAARRSDIGVLQAPPSTRSGAAAASVAVLPAPVESRVLLEVTEEILSIEIRSVADMVLVTAIEILSPVNKRRGHDAYHDYLRKRRDLLRSAAHLIEIDLLRAGERPPLESPVPPAPYYVTLARANRRPGVQVWPIQMWDKLPVIPVPLREPDPDAAIDLPVILGSVYEDGGYDLLIDYRQPPPPPELSQAEAEWLQRLLVDRGLR